MPTTAEEFDLFKSECAKWIDYFGLIDWRVSFVHEKLSAPAYAESRVNGIADRDIVFAFNTELDEEKDRPFLDVGRTAFHEVCELLTWPLEFIGTCRYVQAEEFVSARHALIRTLENTVFRDLRGSVNA